MPRAYKEEGMQLASTAIEIVQCMCTLFGACSVYVQAIALLWTAHSGAGSTGP